MSKPSAPPAPDYEAAALAQGEANLDAARASAKLSNPNVIGPLGSQTVQYGGGSPTFDQANYDKALKTYQDALSGFQSTVQQQGGSGLPQGWTFDRGIARDPQGRSFVGSAIPWESNPIPPMAPDPQQFFMSSGDPDVPTVTQTLSPEQQKIFNETTQIKDLLGDVGIQGAESLKGVVGTPVDYTGAPEISGSQATRDAVIKAMMSRVDEDTEKLRGRTQSNLIAGGIPTSSDAYADAMHGIDRGYNDARQRAILAAGQEAQRDFGMDMDNRRRYIAELLSKRQTPLNEISAVLSGSQVNNPFSMPGYSGANVAPAPLYGATQAAGNYAGDLYNADVGGYNAMMQGLMGLGSTALMFANPALGLMAAGASGAAR